MGMASSQVRLLMITNRLHDIEYKAQCIQNAKIMLSMLEDDAYQDFLAAQEGANTITIGGQAANNVTSNDITAGLGAYLKGNDGTVYASPQAYAAYDAAVGAGKASANDDDYKKFAWYMANGTDAEFPNTKAVKPKFKDMADKNATVPEGVGFYKEVESKVTKDDCTEVDVYYSRQLSDGQVITSDKTGPVKIGEDAFTGEDITVELTEADRKNKGWKDNLTGYIYSTNAFTNENGQAIDSIQRKNQSGINLYRLVKCSSSEGRAFDKSRVGDVNNMELIGCKMTDINKGAINSNNATYIIDAAKSGEANEQQVYFRRTAAQQEAEWKESDNSTDPNNFSIDGQWYSAKEVEDAKKFNNPDSTYMSIFREISKAYGEGRQVSGEQLNAHQMAQMVQGGTATIVNPGMGTNTDNGAGAWNTVVDPSNPFNYSVSTGQDSTAIAKASAKYEAELRKIDRKEKQYDTELAKIETERTALTKEMDGIKKVKDDNIERTFGIFS